MWLHLIMCTEEFVCAYGRQALYVEVNTFVLTFLYIKHFYLTLLKLINALNIYKVYKYVKSWSLKKMINALIIYGVLNFLMNLGSVEICNQEIFLFIATRCCVNILVSDPRSAEENIYCFVLVQIWREV